MNLKNDLEIEKWIIATGNPNAWGFIFFAHPLCTLRDALGLKTTPPHIVAHLKTRTCPRTNQRFAKELQFPTHRRFIVKV